MRSNIIDSIRGVAFILMLIHHFYYFNPKYSYVPKNVETIGLISRTLFVFLVGFNIKYYEKKKIKYKNQIKILIAALLVTFTTYIFLPFNKMIFFGILHFIFVSTFLMKHLSFNYLLILLILILSKVGKRYLNFNITDNYFKLALAGSSFNKNPIDIFQLFEWIPLVCIGMITGGIFKEFDKEFLINNKITFPLEFIGKNSLILYLIHVIPCIYWMSFKFKKQ